MQNSRKALIGSGLMASAASSFAALPAAANTAITDVLTAVGDVVTGVWPIVAAVVVGFGIISLFKKGVGKAV